MFDNHTGIVDGLEMAILTMLTEIDKVIGNQLEAKGLPSLLRGGFSYLAVNETNRERNNFLDGYSYMDSVVVKVNPYGWQEPYAIFCSIRRPNRRALWDPIMACVFEDFLSMGQDRRMLGFVVETLEPLTLKESPVVVGLFSGDNQIFTELMGS